MSNLFDLFGKFKPQKKQDNTHIAELEDLLQNDIAKVYDVDTTSPRQCEDNIQKYQRHYKENIYMTPENKSNSNNTEENVNDLKLRLKNIELERDIYYLKNEKLLNKLSQTHKQIKDIESAQSIVDHKIFIKLMHKTKRIKKLKQSNKELTKKLSENELKLQKQTAEMHKNNKSLQEMNFNINELTEENFKLKAELLGSQQAVNASNAVNKSIINKLQQNHRMIRYLQGFMDTKLNEYNMEFGNKKSKMDGNVNGLCMIRVILIFMITMIVSVSWGNINTYEESNKWNGDNMDMFITMKHVSYEIYDTFMLSENIMYFVDFMIHSLNQL
eukprot:508291_1